MKAICVHAFGTPDGVILDEIERPEIEPADALVQVEDQYEQPFKSYVSAL
jgi:hypothetical protein